MIRNVCDFLDKTAQKHPNKTAFVCNEKSITYKEFDEISDKLASKIISFKLKNEPVLIILEKGISALISFFGVAKSGNFYSIIDAKTPQDRIESVIEILKPKLIIAEYKLDFTDIIQISPCEFENFSIDKNALKTARDMHIDTNLLYVLFTSGSTGVPKGVSISHKSVIDYTFWVSDTFKISSDEVLANQAPFYFDNSILDIFSTIKSGATLHILPTQLFAFPLKILEYLKAYGVTFIFWVPSVLIYFANQKALEKCELNSLKKVLFCGEIMPNKQLNIWRKALPNALFANLYGPTEITDVCAYFIVDRNFNDDELLPIGNACKNTELLVFDDDLKLITKPNIKGELYVRGTSLSLGYYANSQKSDEVFVQNPLHNNYKDIVYKTGDIVAYNDNFELVCYGRKDSQIKLLGHRIELGEIEAVLNAVVLNSACIFKNGEIICFYENTNDIDVKKFLSQKLPNYMVPKRFVRVEKFALNQNGKIDRKALSERV
ncbi:amino acid adenylation domain-containing protein [Campylobacter mucosalis]|uniref:AMP-forming adenylation domain superfamily protein, putative D-alanine:D-alanyl carrier protein ligase n=1 Tax=Campylobacter mucosalis CCUG 21559 TaxID=1032067 RepID=A0A6G5QFW4_9BACT|nr:amino acid adenylation domain-containing protein [Campylobacter mucosalis]QCD44603.1 AMP-forming adenylation domain superfamily protein, putative D-alanine:D-alanyl carrier protein ligase [Campylobacter mucosalis CCUG 21559]